ncbi:MAG: GrpB family protein [FCB group bacterium]|jgi:GrpB-like predicted nucleotidyltransferase (UPF0157 family)|nr:GrpB family protein [FCB group bacterium]
MPAPLEVSDGTAPVIMRLIGAERAFAADDPDAVVWAFYSETLDRLNAEVLPTVHGPTRRIGFERILDNGQREQFLGLDVRSLEHIPEGLCGWELSRDALSTWRERGGHVQLVARRLVRWMWLHDALDHTILPLGEFAVTGHSPHASEFHINIHAYAVPRDEPLDDAIRLVDYDPLWPARFEEFAAWLREALTQQVALRIEHYGSTAIPGIRAKPIIDVLVEVPSFAKAREHAFKVLNRPEWESWWCIDHIIFMRRDPLTGTRTHHVHLVPPGHREWQSLVFRDHLRSHPEDARRYAALKHHLATQFGNDRERYTEEKTEFVREILERAGNVSNPPM